MIALDGFWLTGFVPVAVMTLLGLGCLWGYRRSEQNMIFFFVAAIFLVMVLWRIPVVVDRRYMLPVIVPGILFAVLFIKTLSEKGTPVGRWFCGILLLATAIAGTAKAMRFQEAKPYLTEIPAIINEDIKKNHWESAYVLILGNGGGRFDFDESVTINQRKGDFQFGEMDGNEAFFKLIDSRNLDNFLLRYPVMYIFIVSNASGDVFSENWQNRYGQSPELCYEFIRPKDQRRSQVFRIVSPYQSAHMTSADRLAIYRRFNLLPNPDFSQCQELAADDPELQALTKRGVTFGKKEGRTSIPADWEFILGNREHASEPVGLEYTARQKLRIYSCDYVAFRQMSQPFAGGKIYQLGGWMAAPQDLVLFVQLLQVREGKTPSRVDTFPINISRDQHEMAATLDLSDRPGEYFIQLSFARGDIELDNICLVEQSVFNTITQKDK